MKKYLSMLLALIMVFSLSTAAFASSNEIQLSPTDKQELHKNLTELGITQKTQSKLIQKLERGQVWDSMNPDMISKVPANALTPTENSPIKRFVFPDGSVIQVEMSPNNTPESESHLFMAMSSSSGSGYYSYTDKKISITSGLVGYGFYADFTLVNGSYDYISDVYDPFVNVIGGSGSINSLNIDRSTETSTRPATATLSVQVDFAGGVAASGTHILKFEVSNDSYRSYEK